MITIFFSTLFSTYSDFTEYVENSVEIEHDNRKIVKNKTILGGIIWDIIYHSKK